MALLLRRPAPAETQPHLQGKVWYLAILARQLRPLQRVLIRMALGSDPIQ